MSSAKRGKGRSIVQPGQTLHHFFKTAPHRQIEPNTNSSSRVSISREIIVIDSDNDENVEILEFTKPLKRRRLSADAHSNLNPDQGLSTCPKPSDKEPVQNYSFGRPSVLLQDSPVKRKDAGHSEHPFGVVNRVSEETGPSSSKINNVDIDLTLEDWENGDNEQPFELKTEDDWMNAKNEMLNPDSENSLSETIEQSATSNLLPIASSGCTVNQKTLASCDGKVRLGRNNAFSVLMSSVKETEAWKEASVDKTSGPPQAGSRRRKAPFYKVLQGMPIAVDAFNFGEIPGVTAYFLTHAHSDHYTNLSSNWKHGSIYCSEGTANLIIHMLSVDRKWVHPLPMDTPSLIPNTSGVTVTLIEANHCPGSCLFLFEGPQIVNAGDSSFKSHFIGSSKIFRYLHCGDFRASPQHILHPAVHGKLIDHVYLDTTYLDPRYTFPPQPLVISACAELSQRIFFNQPLNKEKTGLGSWISLSKGKDVKTKTLVVVGTYSIGKERIVKAIAQALNSKVYCDARKSAILKCQADPDLDALLTSNPMDATVHIVPLSMITTDRLKIYLDRFKGSYDKIMGFRPTGWTYSPPAGTDQSPSVSSIISRSSQKEFTCADLQLSGKSSSTILIYPVPYSEHSSFYELTCFAMSFNWTKMIATVNVGNEASRRKIFNWVSRWQAERKKRGEDIIIAHRRLDYW